MIDTHAHIFLSEYDSDREAMLHRAAEAGVTDIVLPCIDAHPIEVANNASVHLHKTLGLHPTEVCDDFGEILARMQQYVDSTTIAIGEIGLDYYWDTTYAQQQKEALVRQLDIARTHALPVLLHTRGEGALQDVLQLMKDKEHKGIFHCFGGTEEEANRILDLNNFYFGIGGIATYKNSTLPATLAETVPLNRIALETDSPYLSPVPHRGKRNEPAFLTHIVAKLSSIYKVSTEEIIQQTTTNARNIFNI